MDAEWERQFEEHRKRVKEIAETLHQYCSEDEQTYSARLNDLRDLVKRSEHVKAEAVKLGNVVNRVIQQVKEKEDKQYVDMVALYEEEVASGVTETPTFNYVEEFDNFVQSLGEEADLSLVITQATAPMIDPWTKKPIVNPVKSNTCGHLYDSASINAVLTKMKEFRCPHVGCKTKITKKDLMDA